MTKVFSHLRLSSILAVAALFLAALPSFAQTTTKTQEIPKKTPVTVYVRVVSADEDKAGNLFFETVAKGLQTAVTTVSGVPDIDSPDSFELVFHVTAVDKDTDIITAIVLAHTKGNQFSEYINSGSGGIVANTAETVGKTTVDWAFKSFNAFVTAKGTTKGIVN